MDASMLECVKEITVRCEYHSPKVLGFSEYSGISATRHAHFPNIENLMLPAKENRGCCLREVLIQEKRHATAS